MVYNITNCLQTKYPRLILSSSHAQDGIRQNTLPERIVSLALTPWTQIRAYTSSTDGGSTVVFQQGLGSMGLNSRSENYWMLGLLSALGEPGSVTP